MTHSLVFIIDKVITFPGRQGDMGALTMTADERLVDRIYEAAAFPDHWPDVLDALARRLDAAGVVLVANSTAEWSGRWEGWTTSPGMREAFADFMKKGVAKRTKATPRLLAMDRPGFVPDNVVFTREEWLSDPHVVEWSRDWGFDHAAATAIRSPSGELAVIHLERLAGHPEFSRQDLDLLDSFRPHLARALALAARWRLERLRTAVGALATIGLPALIVGGSGRGTCGQRSDRDVSGLSEMAAQGPGGIYRPNRQ